MITKPRIRTLLSTGSLTALLSLSCGLFPVITHAQIGVDARQGFPGRRVGGGTRGDCSTVKPLIALTPQNNLSLTSSAAPSLWFYVPASETMKQIEFVLYDHADKLIYETTLPTPAQDGIMRVALPNSDKLAPLAIGETYHWYFSLICPTTRAADVSVDGGLQRIALPDHLADQLKTATSLDQAELYQNAGLWNDALTILADLHAAQHSDPSVANQWAKLLQSAGLEHITQESIRTSFLR